MTSSSNLQEPRVLFYKHHYFLCPIINRNLDQNMESFEWKFLKESQILGEYLTLQELLNLCKCCHSFTTFLQSARAMTAIAIPPKGFPRSLRELDLWKINVSTTDWLIPLHSLERLTLACVEFNVRQIVDGGITIQYNCWQTFHKLIWEASKLQELSYFCLTGVYFDDNSTIEFPPQIRHLNLCGCCFTSKQLAGIKSLPPLLETLDLRSNRLDTIVASILRRFWSILPPSLHTLDITNNFLQDKVVLNQRVHVLQ